ncbi:hypothetical protein A7L51_18970 [Acinetobacter baumannii]|nr:hypothetical protein A7L51_18970 [Acinetobacter baumannii]
MTHLKLNGSTADGEVGTLRLDVIEPSAREGALLVIIETTRGWVLHFEVGEGKGKEREREKGVGKHLDGKSVCVGIDSVVG